MARVYHHWDTEAELTLEVVELKNQIKRINQHNLKQIAERDLQYQALVDQNRREVKNSWIVGGIYGFALGIVVATLSIQLFW